MYNSVFSSLDLPYSKESLLYNCYGYNFIILLRGHISFVRSILLDSLDLDLRFHNLQALRILHSKDLKTYKKESTDGRHGKSR